MIITVKKIGIGTEEDPIRPETEAKNWKVIEEYENEFLIEISE